MVSFSKFGKLKNMFTPLNDDDLWIKIRNHKIGSVEDEYSFLNRLAFENRWSKNFSLKVFEEYKRFIYLLCHCNHPVTPSVEVDQVWHLHLLYTRDYWDKFVPKLTKVPHHEPTSGGQDEARKFIEYYNKTLISYKKIFDENPPRTIWPESSSRFETKFQIKPYNPRKFLLIRKSEFIIFTFLMIAFLIYSHFQ